MWGKLLPRHPFQQASPWDWSWAMVGTICVFTAQNSEILQYLQWTSACSNWLLGKSCLLTSLILLRESKYHHIVCLLCTEQHGLWWVCVLHCWGGFNSMTPPEISASCLQYGVGLWILWQWERTNHVEIPLPILFIRSLSKEQIFLCPVQLFLYQCCQIKAELYYSSAWGVQALQWHLIFFFLRINKIGGKLHKI